jgi:protein-disulfide isomerase
MAPTGQSAGPSGHTPDGGVLVGSATAAQQMILFEDPQCPYCRRFEELNGHLIGERVESDALAVEYRMRCFLGPESVRADNALALAAEAGGFDKLRRALFANQPPEGAGGFTTDDLLQLGAELGLTGSDFVAGVREGKYENWVQEREDRFQREDPQGTPAGWLNGAPIDPEVMFNPSRFQSRLRE